MTEKTELEALKQEIADLKQRIDPPPRPRSTHQPYDPTANFSMPLNALLEMMKATPEGLMRDLRADALKPNPVTGGMTKPPSEPPKAIGTKGWIDSRPLEPPPGVSLVDQIAEAFAARERRGG